MAGLLTSVGDDKDKAAVYLADCRKLGITVLPPDVNESLVNFASVGTDIRFGLGAVRNVGANVVGSLISTRNGKGKFTDFSDYLNKIDIAACNKKVTESLIKAGAFDSLGHARKGLFLVHTDAVDSVLGTKKARRSASSTCSAATTGAPKRCSPSRCPTTSGRTSTSSRWSGRCWASTCPGIRSTGGAPAGRAGGHPDPGHPRR